MTGPALLGLLTPAALFAFPPQTRDPYPSGGVTLMKPGKRPPPLPAPLARNGEELAALTGPDVTDAEMEQLGVVVYDPPLSEEEKRR